MYDFPDNSNYTDSWQGPGRDSDPCLVFPTQNPLAINLLSMAFGFHDIKALLDAHMKFVIAQVLFLHNKPSLFNFRVVINSSCCSPHNAKEGSLKYNI